MSEMKRMFCLLLVLLLLPVGQGLAAEHDFNGAFQIRCSDDWELDRTFGEGQGTETFCILGSFETFTSVIEVSISDDRAYYEDFTVPTRQDSNFYGYLSELMAMLENTDGTVQCEYIKAVSSGDGKAQFLIFYVDDGEGGYYYADTMLKGCTLLFYAYSTQSLLGTGARQLAELETMLSGITFVDTLF